MQTHTRNSAGLLREKEVLDLIPVSPDTWKRWIATGYAPRPVRLGERRVYDAGEIQGFIEKLIAARDSEEVRDAA